jgi:XTP/dITP diphosphohydrolase
VPYLAEAGVGVEALAPPSERELAQALLAAAAESTVVWLSGADGDPGLAPALAAEAAAVSDAGWPVPEIEVVHGSYDLPGARLLDLVAVMDRLRSPGGCPWDAKQTHASLVTYLLEESYETVESIESGSLEHLCEELGDLLLQIVFHARIAEEHADDPFSIDDVAGGIVDKLVSRHPHVFGDVHAPTAEHVEANWEVLKAAEKRRTSAVEGVPMAQPALALAAKLMSRAARAGVDVPVAAPPVDESADLGELLLGLVALARQRGLDPEGELRAAARRYADRVRAAEAEGHAGA